MGREMVPVAVPQKKGKPDLVIKQDEEFSRCVCYIFLFMPS